MPVGAIEKCEIYKNCKILKPLQTLLLQNFPFFIANLRNVKAKTYSHNSPRETKLLLITILQRICIHLKKSKKKTLQ